jgi:hypothetical protein
MAKNSARLPARIEPLIPRLVFPYEVTEGFNVDGNLSSMEMSKKTKKDSNGNFEEETHMKITWYRNNE